MNNRASRLPVPLPLVILLLGALVPMADASSFAEPSTVFYGKVTGTASSRPFLVTEGELTWTIRRADGSDLALRAPLFPLNDGEFSYRLDVPHTVLGVGLQADGSSQGVPLPVVPQSHAHLSIALDGLPARIAGPNGVTFDADQARRAATYRLDLEVDVEAPDSDGDGLPDWWEDLHGLDKEDPSDANLDLDGDGLTNLAEFLGRTDPNADSRHPKLLSREIIAYHGAISGLILEVTDTDSDPAVIMLTLDREPQTGMLYRRNAQLDAGAPNLPIPVGGRFSLQDVQRGLINFVPDAQLAATYDRIDLTVEDEDPAHDQDSATVEMIYYQPDSTLLASHSPDEALYRAEFSRRVAGLADVNAQRFRSHILGNEAGCILRDPGTAELGVALSTPTSGMTQEDYEQSYQPFYGSAHRHVLMDSMGNDVMAGGMNRDILTGGRGSDSFTGGPGLDDFVFLAFDDQADSIADFVWEDGDRVLLSLPPGGQSTYIDDYVRATPSGSDLLLEIDLDGSGDEYADALITVAGVPTGTSLRDLWEAGRFLADGFVLQPYLGVEATESLAYEAGSTGIFTITRGGDASEELTVSLSVTGSATNGVDFQQVSAPLTIPAGVRTLEVPIIPFPDSVSESLGEVVQLTLLPGGGYAFGDQISAQVEVRDPIPVISLQTLGPMASQQDGIDGMILLRRGAAIDQQALVSLELGGVARNGIDYEFVSNFVVLESGQTLRLIPIRPRAGATLQGGAEMMQMRVLEDSSYLLGSPSTAGVTIVERTTSYEDWIAEHFPDAPADLTAFGATDPGGHGLPVRQRYAFGSDPLQPANSARGTLLIDNGHLFIEVGVRPGALDLNYVPEVSLEGTNWQRGAEWATEVPPPFGTGDARRRLFRATKSMEELEMQLLRVKAE